MKRSDIHYPILGLLALLAGTQASAFEMATISPTPTPHPKSLHAKHHHHAATSGKRIVASTPTPTPTPIPTPALVDIHPYQSQTFLRLAADDLIETIPAMSSDYKIFHPGGDPESFTDTMLIYDKDNPLPALQTMGGNYAFFQGGYFATVSADGYLIYKGKMNFTPGTIGGVYFIKKENNELVVINSDGRFFETGTIVTNVRLAGGNWYIDSNGQLTTIRSYGDSASDYSDMIWTTNPGVSYADANFAGGNYFVNKDGTIITISALNAKISLPWVPAAAVNGTMMGGNYFVGVDNYLYSIASTGELLKNDPLTSVPLVMGYSYMKLADGTFIWIDVKGNPHTKAVRVSSTGATAGSIQAIDDLEAGAAYIPSKAN
jgi:hypothetical protein